MERDDLKIWKAREVARLLALIETESRYYQEMVASLPVGVLILSIDLSIISANRNIRTIFGLSNVESVRTSLNALLPRWVLDRVQEVLKTGKSQTEVLADTKLNGGRTLRLGIQLIHKWMDEAEHEVLLTIEDVTDLRAPAGG